MPVTDPATASHAVCNPFLTLDVANSSAIRNASAATTPLPESKVITVKTEKPRAEWPLGHPPLRGVPFLNAIFSITTSEMTTAKATKVMCHGDRIIRDIPSETSIIFTVLKI